MDPIGAILILLFAILYFLPWIIAGQRDHPNNAAIGLLNLFLGWTLIGWVIALVWAAIALPEFENQPPHDG